jgi:diguanylate cyclase (GGDEF)-like protein
MNNDNQPLSKDTIIGELSSSEVRGVETTGKYFTMTIIEGVDFGCCFPIEKAETLIGRNCDQPESDILVEDGKVSRRHLLLVKRQKDNDSCLTAVDLGSRNGSFINNERISGAEILLHTGDKLKIGDTVLKVEIKDSLDQQASGRLYEQVTRDPLTGLLNRNHITQEINKLLGISKEQSWIFSLLLIELNQFDLLVDKYGTTIADKVIRVIADKLVKELSGTDMIARFAAHQFLIVLPQTDINGSQRVADQLRLMMEKVDLSSCGCQEKITISMGIVQYPISGQTAPKLIKQATNALINAQQNKKDQIGYVSGLPAILQTGINFFIMIERTVILFTAKYGVTISRISLGLVFFWFGMLKTFGFAPPEIKDLVIKIIYLVPKEYAIQFLGVAEVLIGIALLFRIAQRLTMVVFFGHMMGTFLVLVLRPELSFQPGNPFLLTTTGEFVIKNIVLLATGVVVLSTIRRTDERLWMRQGDPQAKAAKTEEDITLMSK